MRASTKKHTIQRSDDHCSRSTYWPTCTSESCRYYNAMLLSVWASQQYAGLAYALVWARLSCNVQQKYTHRKQGTRPYDHEARTYRQTPGDPAATTHLIALATAAWCGLLGALRSCCTLFGDLGFDGEALRNKQNQIAERSTARPKICREKITPPLTTSWFHK